MALRRVFVIIGTDDARVEARQPLLTLHSYVHESGRVTGS
jgi:hypothetical protein